MEKLSYSLLESSGYNGYLLREAPERILQFGEGNFLRAFVDYFVDILNEKCSFDSKVVVVQPIANGLADMINEQDGLYTLYLRGFENGVSVNKKRIISSISRCINPYSDFSAFMENAHNPLLRFIVSNTTEAGIAFDPSCRFDDAPAVSFPAKLTRFLFERFTAFDGADDKGFVILSCELIDNNGKELEKLVLKYADMWGLSDKFKAWVLNSNLFCNTLVDRITTGYPRAEASRLNEQNGYLDSLLDTAEIFGFWVIEAPDSVKAELKLADSGLPILVCGDHKPYKKRKVRILNGAHTSTVLAAYLMDYDIVRDCMNDEDISKFISSLLNDEIIPVIPLPLDELTSFSSSVIERFKNPFIDHRLLDISLNSVSKWKARVMPSMLEYIEIKHRLPRKIVFSFAALLAFYSGTELVGTELHAVRAGEVYTVKDDRSNLEFFLKNSRLSSAEYVKAVASNTAMWGINLSEVDGFCDMAAAYLDTMRTQSMRAAMESANA
ncbi:MAG: tagaturonate reductase [Oscillospiraceae bacterium]